MADTTDIAKLSIQIDSTSAKKGAAGLNELQGAATRTETATDKLAAGFKKMGEQMEAMSRSMGTASERMSASFTQLGNQLNGISRATQTTSATQSRAFNAVSRESKQAAADQGRAAAAIRDTGTAAATAGLQVGGLTSAFKMLALQVGGIAALTAGLRAATKEALNFSTGMASIATLLEDDQMGMMDGLTDRVKALGDEFGRTPIEQAKGLYEIMAAGVADSATAMDILTVSNKLAIGGITDVQTASDGLTTVLAAYEGQVESATEAADKMFFSAAIGKTDIEGLSKFIGKVAPIAAQTGVSLGELSAMAGVLTQNGQNTMITMQGIRAILMSVLSPTKEATDLAAQLGVDYSTAGVKAKGLTQFLRDLNEATGGNQTTLAKLLGTTESILPAMTVLSEVGVRRMDEALQGVSESAGLTERAFNLMADTPQFRLDQLAAKFSNLKIVVGDRFLNTINPGIGALSNNFESLASAAGKVASAMAIFAAARAGSWVAGMVQGLVASTAAANAARQATISAALAEANYTRASGESARAALRSAMAQLQDRQAKLQNAIATNSYSVAANKATLQSNLLAQAKLREASATAAASTAARAGAGAMALLGGPVGLAITGIGVLAATMLHFSNAADKARESAIRMATGAATGAAESRRLIGEIARERSVLADARKTQEEHAQAAKRIEIAKGRLISLSPEFENVLKNEKSSLQDILEVMREINKQSLAKIRSEIALIDKQLEEVQPSKWDTFKEQAKVVAGYWGFGSGSEHTNKAAFDAANIAKNQAPLLEQRRRLLQEALNLEEAMLETQQKETAEVQKNTSAKNINIQALKDEVRERERLARRIEDFVKGLEQEAATLGMTREEALKLSDEYKGLSDSQRARADGAIAAIEQFKAKEQAIHAVNKAMEMTWDLIMKPIKARDNQLANEMERLRQELNPLEQMEIRLSRVNKLYAEGRISMKAHQQESIKLARQMSEDFDTLSQAIEGVAKNMSDAFVDFAMTGELNFKKLIDGIIEDTIRLLAHKAFMKLVDLGINALGGALGGGSSFSFMPSASRASGGAVHRGQVMEVGERGPELFVPSSHGTIIPNNQLGGGSSTNVSVTVNVADGGAESSVQASPGNRSQAEKMGRGLADAVRRTVLQEMQPGGMVYTFVRGS